jgi:predicted MFS family arabinose efflux permease
LIERNGWAAPFWAAAAAAAAVYVVLAVVLRELSPAADRASGSAIVWDRASVGFLAGTVLIVGSVEMIFITFATWLEDSHGFTVTGLAAVATAIGVAELAAEGGTVALTDRFGKSRAVALGLGISAAGFLVIALFGSDLVPGLAGLVIGIGGFEFGFVSSISLGTELQPAARITFLSRYVVAQAAGRALAALVALAILGAFGMAIVAAVAAAVALAAALVILATLRDHEAAATRRGARSR